MQFGTLFLTGFSLYFLGTPAPEAPNKADGFPRHVKVYAEPGRFGGWPANHGIWSWGDEILVGFSAGYFKDNGPERHNIDHDKPEEHLLARSLDGGETWTIENPAAKGALIPAPKALHGIVPPGLVEKSWEDCPGGIDFTHPDFALTIRMTDTNSGPSRFYYSTDRGKNWLGPFRLPLFGQKGIAARTGYAIMPSTVRLGSRELLTAVRCRDGAKSWLNTYRTLDDGRTWTFDTRPAPDLGEGNPASMLRLADGRVCLT